MEPFPKRQRLYAPREDIYDHRYDDDLGSYATGDAALEEEDYGEETDEQVYDPEDDFQQRRAQLDYKLKSTFEGIFEKYGKDFDGIGDEIDLETEQVVVNNRHLLEMHNERDAGRGRARMSREEYNSITQHEDTSGSGDELCYDEEDDDDLEEASEDLEIEYDDQDEDAEQEYAKNEMIEDDLILRQGFFQASSHLPRPQKRKSAGVRLSAQGSALPSKSEILDQFGPQLGPQIVQYISNQRKEEQSHIEPAWRIPNPPPSFQRTEKPKSRPPPIYAERSPSPNAGISLWAPVRTRKRRSKVAYRRDPANEGRRISGEIRYGADSPDSFDEGPLLGLGRSISNRQQKRVRNAFTDEEDDILLDFVANAKAEGSSLRLTETWRRLAEMYPRHTQSSWMHHYRRKFTYLDDNMHPESELFTSDTADDQAIMQNRRKSMHAYDSSLNDARSNPKAYLDHRSTRIRKPAPRVSGVMSWSEAVDTIESVDPVLHGAILKDTRAANGGYIPNTFFGNAVPKTGQGFGSSYDGPLNSRQDLETQRHQHLSRTPAGHPPQFMNGKRGRYAHQASHPQNSVSRRDSGSQAAPCPHVDCRMHHEALYLLNRRDGEDQSEMCQHLLRVHHITPFPCGEVNCARKGERGYFSQQDLVSHVKSAHTTLSALRRLQGRVDEELLGLYRNQSRHRSTADPPHNPYGSIRRHSVLVSPELDTRPIPPSSELLSPISDHDLTLTPGGSSSRIGPASTPKTSVSLFYAGTTISPENVAKPPERSNSRLLSPSPPGHDGCSQIEISNSARKAMQLPGDGRTNSGGRNAKKWAATGADNQPSGHVQQTVPVPNSVAQFTNVVTPPSYQRQHQSTFGSRRIPNSRTSVPETPVPSSIADSRSSLAVVPSSSPLFPRSADHALQPSNSTIIERNIVDQSYEFSDEEELAESLKEPAKTAAPTPPKTSVETPAGAPLNGPGKEPTKRLAEAPKTTQPPTRVAELSKEAPATTSKLQSITPAMRRKLQKSLRRSLDFQDVDELSLGTADIILLSSRARSRKLPCLSEYQRIKDEPVGTPVKSVEARMRKRKFATLGDGDGDEVDELAAQDAVDLLKTPGHTSKVGRTKVAGRSAVGSSPWNHDRRLDGATMPRPANEKTSPKPHTAVSLNVRPAIAKDLPESRNKQRTPAPSTPLLDLTPEGTSTKAAPVLGLATAPALHTSGSSAAARQSLVRGRTTAVLVQTPNGTLRRCGEDGFSCRMAFCFTCLGR